MLPLLQIHRPSQPFFNMSNQDNPESLTQLSQAGQHNPYLPPVQIVRQPTQQHHLTSTYALPHHNRPFPSHQSLMPIVTVDSSQRPPYITPTPSSLSSYRPIPITSTSPALSQFPENSEHRLRRKTPSGTVDAGYDGSLTQMHPGPPLKHIALPISSAQFQTQLQNMSLPHYHQSTDTSMTPFQDDILNAVHAIGLSQPARKTVLSQESWPTVSSSAAPVAEQAQLNMNNIGSLGIDHTVSMSDKFYQTSYTRPLDCIAYPRQDHLVSPLVGHFSYNNQVQDLQQLYALQRNPMLYPPSFLSTQDQFSTDSMLQSHPSLISFIPYSQPNLVLPNELDSLKFSPLLYSNPSHLDIFRRKVISAGYQVYIDLIGQLQTMRKNTLGKVTRSQIYPKPPKPQPHNVVLGRHSTVDGHPSIHMTSDTYPLQSEHNPLSRNITPQALVDILFQICDHSGWDWYDGILLGGCLYYAIGNYEKSLEWFSRIISSDVGNIEARVNMAATLYSLNRLDEAEKHWIMVVQMKPDYLEIAEHVVGILYGRKNQKAIDLITFIQGHLRVGRHESSRLPETTQIPGYGSSGYRVPGTESFRLISLIHAKGTILYSMKDIKGAAKAFEEAVLISTGSSAATISELIHEFSRVLSKSSLQSSSTSTSESIPLLLSPEQAKSTAHLLFPPNGMLPGLQYINDSAMLKLAMQTTSNSLLSLAKIFQDSMTSGVSAVEITEQHYSVSDILILYYLSLSLQESPSTANNVGILLASIQVPTTGSRTTNAHTQLYPALNIPGVTPGSGLELALVYYNYGLSLDPKHVHLHTNLGSLLKDIGQLDLAIQMYEQAVACDSTFDIALTNLANAVKDRGRVNEAITYYKRAVKANPDFAEAICGLLTALNSVCDWRGRGGSFLDNGLYDRWHVSDDGILQDSWELKKGTGLTQRVVDIVGHQISESSKWGHGVVEEILGSGFVDQVEALGNGLIADIADLKSELANWKKTEWQGTRVLRLIERINRVTMWTWYQDRYVHGKENDASNYTRIALPPQLSLPSAPTVLPFHTFTCPLGAKDVRMISQLNAHRISVSTLRSPWLRATVYPPPPPPAPHLNIGYVSSDFNNHPLAHLMQSVFGFHDEKRVRAFCYATTPSDHSVHREQIEREAPVFHDVSSWTNQQLIDKIVSDGIHILVNLNGYTRGARNEVFAARPSPIQMTFMGFAGTLGAEWCDYFLADPIAIPQETLRPWRSNAKVSDVFRDGNEEPSGSWVYGENIIYCRDTFFCCDHAQSSSADDQGITWEMEEERRWKMRKELFPTLPDDAIILGNFNQLYKIDPTTFRTWLRILSYAPKAVLWLLRFPELGESHLRRTALNWAGPEVASRIIFTDIAPKHLHISRARVCDLFLDTPECNAHTTAADVLWSSTPMVTLPRYPYKMCSRIAASIIHGALPKTDAGELAAKELIASDDAHYEKAAITLASSLTYQITSEGYGSGRGRLSEIRKLLFHSKWTCGLFSTRRWVRDLEDAYEKSWQNWVQGISGDIWL